MKYDSSLFQIFNVVLLFAFLITISISINHNDVPDYSTQLAKFLKHEDSRDLNKILDSYLYPVENYWNQKNLQRNELETAYKKAWKNVEYSSNSLIEIKKLNNFNFVLTTQFKYKLKNKNNESIVRSKLNFKLNNGGKIISIDNIELIESSSSTDNDIAVYKAKDNQKTNGFIRTHIHTLIVIFLFIIINIWWIILTRRFEKKQKKLELIEKSRHEKELLENERLAKLKKEREKEREGEIRLARIKERKIILEREVEEKINSARIERKKENHKQWLIKTIEIDSIHKEDDVEILKLIETLKNLNSELENTYKEKEKNRLVKLIKKKHLINIQKIKERRKEVEKKRLVKIEKEKLAKIENERLRKIAREKENKRLKLVEKRKLDKLKKEDEERLLKIKKRHEKEKSIFLKQEREDKERLEEGERNRKNKSTKLDLSQYLGEIDENIINEEKSKGNNDEDLRKYLTGFDNKQFNKTPEHSNLNKEELKSLIINQANNKAYAYNNSQNMVKLCRQYFNHYGWDLRVLKTIITALSTDKQFKEAYIYADIVCKEINYKWGFFFKGEVCWYKGDIYEGSRFFSLSATNNMDKKFINSRKKEILPYVAAKTRRDMEQLDIEKRGEGRFILNES
jgi:hypothetical protein